MPLNTLLNGSPNVGTALPVPGSIKTFSTQQGTSTPSLLAPRQTNYNINPMMKNLLTSQFPKLGGLNLTQPGTRQIPLTKFQEAMPGLFPVTSSGTPRRMK